MPPPLRAKWVLMMRHYLSILALSLLPGTAAMAGGQADAPKGPLLLSAAEFLKALSGQEFSTRGMIFPAEKASAFSYGYVFAIAAIEAGAGRWCDGHILPHELADRIAVHIEELDDPDETPAEIAVADTLQALGTCGMGKEPQ